MKRAPMRRSIVWALRVFGALLAFAIVALLIQSIVGGFNDADEDGVVRNLFPVIIWLPLFTIVGYEVVRAFLLLVRFLEHNASGPRR